MTKQQMKNRFKKNILQELATLLRNGYFSSATKDAMGDGPRKTYLEAEQEIAILLYALAANAGKKTLA